MRAASLLFIALIAFGQTATKTWTPQKTAWGDPDLEGTWTSDDQRGVPFERPAKFGTRKTLTEQELAERDKENEILANVIDSGNRANVGYWASQKGKGRGCARAPRQFSGICSQIIRPDVACGGSAGRAGTAD